MTTLAEIQSWPEVPAIAHYCSLFRTSLDLIEFEIEELETALLSGESNQDDMFACTLLERLVVRLLRGCLPPTIAAATHEGNFSVYLRKLIQTKQEEAEEEGHSSNFVDPFEDTHIDTFSELSTLDQVRVISQLTEWRLEAADVSERLKDLDPDGMRVEPLGEDSDGITFWYFYGVRLYKEIKKTKPKRPKKKVDEEKDEKFNKSKKAKVMEEVDEVEEVEEITAPRDPPGWYLACQSEREWADLADKYKKSKKRKDRELYEVIMENFMAEISLMFQEKEKEERIRLMMLNKRSSNRLDRKRAEREKEFESKRIELERLELERKVEEEKQQMREKENKSKGRAQRAKLREEAATDGQLARLINNRKRDRETDSQPVNTDSTQLKSDLDRNKRRNPALKEWLRLASINSEEEGEANHAQRNLRF